MKLRVALAVTLAAGSLIAVSTGARAATTGSISGTVTESTMPAAGVFVAVIGIIDQGFFGKGPGFIDGTVTDANGHYTIAGLPPSGGRGYWVCFLPDDWPSGVYDSQCYEQTGTFFPFPSGAGFLEPAPGSKAVPLLTGQNRTGIDADLQPQTGPHTGVITGKVNAFGILPLKHAKVTVDQGGTPAGAAFTATNGVYRIAGLAPGSYHVCFDGSTGGKYTKTCRATLVAVTAGGVTKGINGAVAPSTH